ncbi:MULTISPECIES: c-type cytochrome [Caballeronia]|uniref:Alcohol dehydrogenase n=1 Tax=Caballeronia zhejiangensis TaxID=871203 RepID=A0A656QEQ5_9BURK|nr:MULTISPECIES: cytochrome c [Caballeronia]EKS71648.1 gluconate 2-dehydrogenase (acceptor) [Burkholderia sp. SJ98]KDR25292.1 alcohol dehydrogenase [Caballeronia zhejiangensis]
MNAPRSSKPTTVLLLLLVALAVGACSGSADDHLPTAVTAQSPATSDPKLVARGEYLAKAGDCSACHDAADHTPLGGGLPVNSPFGPIYASNITPDPTFGIGRYSLKEFSDALRYGKRRDGERLYPAMPYASFAKMNDADVTALYAYLMHGVTPAAKRAPRTHLPFPFNQRWGMLFWTFAFGNRDEFSPDPKQSAQWNRGAYLVQGLGHCGACHTPRGPAYNELGYSEASPLYLTGGVVDHWLAPNLTGDRGSGLGRWSRQDIVNFLRTGHGAGTIAFGAMAPAVEDSTQYLTDLDLNAIGEYLKSLPPQQAYGAYDNDARAKLQTARSLETGENERPGAGIYLSFCARCHQPDGRGEPGKVAALAGAPLVLAEDPTSIMRIVIEGSKSPATETGPEAQKMPAFHHELTSHEIAEVISFIRSTWGNHAAPVSDRQVERLRSEIHK